MVDLIIASGQHRNEKSAIILSQLVADSLKKLGQNVLLLFNPEKRTPLEIARNAYDNKEKIKKKELKRILNNWEDKEISFQYPGALVFQFHNYGLNPTKFVSGKEHLQELSSINHVYDSMDFGNFKNNHLAQKVKYIYFPDRVALIEIPEITETYRTQEELAILKRVFHPRTFSQYSTYFLSTDLQKTKEEGLINDEIVQILTHGINYLMHKKQHKKTSNKKNKNYQNTKN